MAFQSNFDDGDDVMAEINMTPLVDVMLVLLIIFIITMPVINEAVKLNLPQANSQTQDLRTRHINISIDSKGQLFWDKQGLTADMLKQKLQQAALEAPQPELHLRADGLTAYEKVAQFLAQAQQAGLSKIAFATQPTP